MTTPTPDPIYVFRKDEELFHSVVFLKTEHGECLVTGTQQGKVLTWNLDTKRSTTSEVVTGELSCIALRFIESTLITQNKEGLATFWTSAGKHEWRRIGEMEMNYTGFCQIAVGKFDGRAIVVCPEERAGLQVYDVSTRKKITCFQPDGDRTRYGEVMACKIVRSLVLAVYENGELIIWDLTMEKAVSCIKLIDDTPMTLDFDERRSLGILGSSGDKVSVFKLDGENQASIRHKFTIKSEGISAVRVRPDGKVFVLGSWDGKVRVFATKTCRQLAVLDFHDVAVLDIAFSEWPVSVHEERTLMAVSAKDGKVSLWDVC